MALVQCMTLVFPLMLSCLLSLRVEIGSIWPFSWSNSIVEIQCRLPEIPLGGADLLVWQSPNGVYSCAATWDQLRVKLPICGRSWFDTL